MARVQLSDVMTVERYSHVMHLCSTVTGRLQPGKTAFDALRSCLPAGTLSGAPKVRAMEIIDELEPHRRGPYGGAVGYIDFSGNMDTCIALRTMVLKGQTAYLQAGAGIVADSVPANEYEETLNKARGLLRAGDGGETTLSGALLLICRARSVSEGFLLPSLTLRALIAGRFGAHMAERYDVLVIGAGPGGYVLAIRAAELGMSVACVEKRASLGGTCLNIGCIPSKALLDSSELYSQAKTNFEKHGIHAGPLRLDLPAMLARKDHVVKGLTDGVAFLFKKNKITSYAGSGRLMGEGKVAVAGTNAEEIILEARTHRVGHRQRTRQPGLAAPGWHFHRQLHRGSGVRACAAVSHRGRRRLHRSGTGFGVGTSWGEGDRPRILAAHSAAERCGNRKLVVPCPTQAGVGVSTGDESHRRRHAGRTDCRRCPA